MKIAADCFSIIVFDLAIVLYIVAAILYPRIPDVLVTHFVSLSNIFLNFKQAIAQFPQLVRHQGQQTITPVPITQNCMPAPIRAPGEGGGAQHMR